MERYRFRPSATSSKAAVPPCEAWHRIAAAFRAATPEMSTVYATSESGVQTS